MTLFENDTKLWKKKLHKSSSNFFRQTDKTEKKAVFLDTSYEVITLTSKSEEDTPQQKYRSLFLRNMNTEILSKILARWSPQHIKWSVYYDQVWSIHECRDVSIYEALLWLSEKKGNWWSSQLMDKKATENPLKLASCNPNTPWRGLQESVPAQWTLCLKTSWAGSHPVAKKLQLFLRLGKEKTHIPSKDK